MKINTSGLGAASLITIIVMASVLGGSQASAPTIQATYSLTEVNGKKLPAISWKTEANGDHCEYLTTGGALLLNLDGRSGGFVMERINCVSAAGIETSTVNDFLMITGTYEISGNEIVIQDNVSTDRGTLDGDSLTITVEGVGIFDGQSSKYAFRLSR